MANKKGIDLFCGMGGMSLGMKMAGIQPVAAVDNWSDAIDVYKKNFPKVKTYVEDVSSKKFRDEFINEWKDKVYLVAGGPPCQSFSNARNKKYEVDEDDSSLDFVYIATKIGPEIIVMENVPRYRLSTTWKEVQKKFKRNGYKISSEVHNAVEFGVPQRRKRFIVIACKNTYYDFNDIPKVEKHISIKDVLPRKPSGTKLNEKTTKILKDRLELTTKERALGSIWYNSYYILDESSPAPTLHGVTNKSHSFGSREYKGEYYDLSPDEAKILQTFPKSYKLHENDAKSSKMIGNAIPPLLIKKLLKFLMRCETRDNA